MRLSEMLKLMPEHVLCPEDVGQAEADGPIVLALGVLENTKSKRPQVVTIQPDQPQLCALVRKCRALTPAGYYMFPYTLAEYRMRLHVAERDLGIRVGWGPHSPRAGWATDEKMAGADFTAIRERGRWLSDQSLRTYLDILSAANVVRALRAAGLSA